MLPTNHTWAASKTFCSRSLNATINCFLSYEKKKKKTHFHPVPGDIHKKGIALKNSEKIFLMKLCWNLHTCRKGSSLPYKNSTNQTFNFISS